MIKTRIAFAAGFLLAAAAISSEAQQAGIIAAPGTAPIPWRDVIGRRLTYVCPANFGTAAIWGTDTYADNSSICNAAVHAGIITRDRGGVVTVITGAQVGSFSASMRNGIQSNEWLAKTGSFTFVRDGAPGQVDWYTNAHGIPAGFTQTVDLVCPPGGRIPVGHTVWGNNVYADDSSICDAAVHAGLATFERGGAVKLKPCGTRASFAGATRNGVTSTPYTGSFGSYTFAQLPCDSLDNLSVTLPLVRDSLDNLGRRIPIVRDSLDNRIARLPTIRDSLDNRVARTPGVRDSLDNRVRGSGVDSLDNYVGQLLGNIGRANITTTTSSDGTRQLSISLRDKSGALVALTPGVTAMLPVVWTTSNSSCVQLVSADALSATVKPLGCAGSVTAKIRKPGTLSGELAATTIQLK